MSRHDRVVQEIHDRFDAAAEEVVLNAKALIQNAAQKTRAEMLQNIGALTSPELVTRVVSAKSRDFLLHVDAIRKIIPDAKVLTSDAVQEIYRKYRLVMAPIARFVGEIPTKNLEEVDKFQREYVGKLTYAKLHNDTFRPTDIRSGFQVVAPKKDFVLKSDEKFDEKTGGFNILQPIPRDPVVLFPTKHGLVIVSKWGVEADYDEFK